MLLMYLTSLTVSDGQSSDAHLPDGAIARFNPGASVYTVAFSSDGQLLASGGTDNAVILWDVSSQTEFRTLIGHNDWVKSVAFSPDGQLLASASMDGSLKLWEISSGINFTSRKQGDRLESVAFSLHGDMLATSGHIDGFIDLWAVSEKRIRHTNRISGHLSGVSSIAFSPHGEMLASAGDDDTLRLWNVDKRSEIKSIAEHSNDVRSVTFSLDGKTLASGSKDNTVKLLEVPSGNVIATLEHDYVESVAFSPDGRTLASAGADYTIKLWASSSQTELASLKGHRSGVTSVAFSPDGRTLASGSRDGTVLIWNLSDFDIESAPAPVAKLVKEPDALEMRESESPSVTILPEDPESTVSENESPLSRSDATPPTIFLNRSITDGMQADAAQFTVRGSVTDNNGIDEVRVNGRKVPVLEGGTFTVTLQLAYGENRIRIMATDASGNMDTNQFTVIRGEKILPPKPEYDPTPPTIVMLAPTERVRRLGDDRFTVQCNVIDDNGVNEVRVNDMETELLGSDIFTLTVPLDYGENLIRVTATDTSGNMATSQFTIFREKLPVPPLDSVGPEIRILYPVASITRGIRSKIYVSGAFTPVSGTVTDPSGVVEVKMNGTEVQVEGDNFDTTVRLNYGDNPIRVTAVDTRGNESEEEIIVCREDYGRKGKDYALLFATESYTHWNSLRNPLFDATAIQQDLKNIYGFQVELVLNPTRAGILEALLKYAEKQYTDEDQLLIFFAGHGYFNEIFKEGYLVAQDTKLPKDDRTMGSYISHSEFRNIVDRMSCKHIFLVMDTCYSGTFDQRIAMRGEAEDVFKSLSSADVKRKLTYTTRWYLTSGDGKVDDGIPGQHSPFARELLEALRSGGGRDDVLTIDEVLYYLKKLEDPRPRASGFGRNEPGSDFLFIKK